MIEEKDKMTMAEWQQAIQEEKSKDLKKAIERTTQKVNEEKTSSFQISIDDV